MDVPEYPIIVYIGITDKCNANCIMCWRRFIDPPYYDMSSELLEKLKPTFEHAHLIGWWGGGEFFCYSEIDKLIDMMSILPNIRHTFSTNGKLLVKYAQKLAQINLTEVYISIDGATEGTLSRIRVGVHLHEIVDGVKALYNEFDKVGRKRPEITFNFIAMCSNVYEMPLLVILAKELEVPKVMIHPLNILHSHLYSESLSIVAPQVEKHYYNIAKYKADELGIILTHSNASIMEGTEFHDPDLHITLDKLLGK